VTPGLAPVSDAQWARQIAQRVKTLENPTQARVGTFVLTDDNAGNLVAHSPAAAPVPIAGPAATAALTSTIQSALYGLSPPTATGVVSTALTDLQMLLSELGLTGIPGLATLISDASTAASNAIADIENLLSGLGVSTGIAGLVSLIAAAAAAAAGAAADIANLLSGLGIGTGITGLVSLIGTAASDASTAVADIENLLSGLGISTGITGLVSLISGAASDASSAVTDIENLLSGLGVSTGITGLVSLISTAASDASGAITDIENLLSGLGISTGITGLVSFISTAATDAQFALSQLASLVVGDIEGLSGYLTNLTSSGNWIGNLASLGSVIEGYFANLTPAGNWSGNLTSLGSTIEGYFAHISSDGAIAAAGITGALTSVVTVAGTAITTLLENITSGGLFDAGKLSNVTGLVPLTLIPSLTSGWGGTVAGSLISGITTLQQNLQDALADFLGGSGTGNTIATLQTLLPNLPLFDQLIEMLVGSGTTFTGATGYSAIITDILTLLGTPIGLGTGQPSSGIAGNSIPAAISDFVDSVVQGLTGLLTSGHSFADVANAAAETATTLTYTQDTAQASAAAIALQAVNNPFFHAVDPTLNAVYNSSVPGTTATTISVTQTSSAIGFINLPAATVKTSFVWQGYGAANLTAAYVNVYSVNPATGVLTQVWASGNVIGYLPEALVDGMLPWVYVPITSPITAPQAGVYGLELVVVGTGTHTMLGMPSHWQGPNPAVYPPQLAATRMTYPLDAAAVYGSANYTTGDSWSHTLAANANEIFVVLNVTPDAAGAGISPTCEVGATPMSLIETYSFTGTYGAYIYVFAFANPPTGAQTITWTVSGDSFVSGVSASFFGVTATGTPAGASGSGTALTQSATGSTAQFLLQMFAQSAGAGTITSYNQGVIDYEAGSAARHNPLLVGYAPGAGSATSFSAIASASDPWAAVAIPVTSSITPVCPASITITGSPIGSAYSQNVPWMALSSETGTPGSYQPQTTPYPQAGSYVSPLWADYLDLVGVGGGGSGQGEIGVNMGASGFAGHWNGVTLTAGVDFTPGVTVFTVAPAGIAGGAGYFSNGNSGHTTTITWTDPTSTPRTFTCTGGAGGYTLDGLGYLGQSAGDYIFPSTNGQIYYGGAGGVEGTGGGFPGGGGGGSVLFQPTSGAGAGGEAWIRAYQS
jgi:hypothetical protein